MIMNSHSFLLSYIKTEIEIKKIALMTKYFPGVQIR